MNNPTTNTKFEDVPIGTRVQVVSHCVDFHFFYGETGVVTKAEDRYLGIKVRFDRPQKFKCVGSDEIYEKEWHNFHPKNLKVISNNGDSVNEQLRSRIKELEGALAGFIENASSLGASHPHLSEYHIFPEWVWRRAQAVLEKK